METFWEEKERGNKFTERRVKKRKLLGMRYFNRSQRTVKENKTGPVAGLQCW